MVYQLVYIPQALALGHFQQHLISDVAEKRHWRGERHRFFLPVVIRGSSVLVQKQRDYSRTARYDDCSRWKHVEMFYCHVRRNLKSKRTSLYHALNMIV